MKTFIRTLDEFTANELKKSGFQLLSENNNEWVFLNRPVNFSENNIDSKKIIETNILNF